jgi:hypothetical protein
MPYLLTRWRRCNGHPTNKSLSIFTGIFGAIGLCFKPYFLLIPLMTELWWLFSTKRFRMLISPENIAAAAAGTIYGAHFLFFSIAQKSAFLEIALNQWLYTKVWGIPVVHAILLLGPFFPFSGYVLLITSVLAGFLYRRHSVILPMDFYCWALTSHV